MTNRILFLDDMLERHKAFKTSAPTDGFVVDHVYTAQQAIDILNSASYVQVFLDHDLSEEDTMCEAGQTTKAPTGMTVVEHIMTMQNPPLDIIIHSCNGPAAELMVARLKEHPAGPTVRRIAFPYLIHALHEAKKRNGQ